MTPSGSFFQMSCESQNGYSHFQASISVAVHMVKIACTSGALSEGDKLETSANRETKGGESPVHNSGSSHIHYRNVNRCTIG